MSHVPVPAQAVRVPQPLHAILVQFPVVCFTLALLTDVAYWQTANLMWQNFSAWLLFAGLVFAGLAMLAGIVDMLRPSVRRQGRSWVHAAGSLVVLGLALLNSFVHAADGWTAVVPWGLALSAVTVVAIIVTNWFGRAIVTAVGVHNHD